MTNLFNRNDGTFAQVDAPSLSGNTILSSVTHASTADVSLNPINTFVDGPTITQGSSGTWYVSGQVTMISSAGAANFYVKLNDGTNIIASCIATSAGGPGFYANGALSGVSVSPAGNLRLTVKNTSFGSGRIVSNDSGLGADSFITAVRIG